MKLAIISSAAILATTLAAGAQEARFAAFDDVYASLKLGVSLPGTVNLDASASSVNGFAPFTGTLSFDAGAAYSLALGKSFTENFRAAVELGVASNTARSYSFTGTAIPNGWATGTINTVSLSAMGYYDFTDMGAFVPYLGAGLGLVNVSTNNLVVQTNTDGTTVGSSTVPMLKLGAGFDYKVSENLSFGLDYSAMIGGRNTLTFTDPVGGPGVAPFSRTITSETLGHALTASVKASF